MITKDLLKDEIDKVRDEHLPVLHRIILAFEIPATAEMPSEVEDEDWRHFVAETYGCLADAPIERGDQGRYEVREEIA